MRIVSLTQKIFFGLLLLYLGIFLIHSLIIHKAVYGDGIFYYSWLHTLVIDHTVDFSNEFSHYGITQAHNKYSIGPALLWMQPYLASTKIFGGTGYEFIYEQIVGITSVLSTITGLILLYRWYRTLFSGKTTLFTLVALALGTHLLFYGALDPINSHSVSFFVTSAFLAILFSRTKNWFAIGLSLGAIGLVRPQDMIIGLLILPFLKTKHSFVTVFLGVTLGFLPQLVAWHMTSGFFWRSLYFGTGEGFIWPPHILEVLFDPKYGVALWTPLTVVGVIGLIAHKTTPPLMRYLYCTVIALSVGIVSMWSTWWQGATFSGRMFVAMLPIYMLGVAESIADIEHTKKFLYKAVPYFIASFAVLNILLSFFFLLVH